MLKFKMFFDKDEEEDWLQKMSLDGWAFRKFFLGLYWFESCEPGEFHYQIDLLDNWSGDKDDYAAFMNDAGVDVICQWWRWVYLQKKAVDGPFEMYTDAQSKISHYSRIMKFFQVALVVEIICLAIELAEAITSSSLLFGIVSGAIAAIALGMLRVVWKCKWKIEQLQEEESA